MESFAPKTPEQGISWAKALVHSNYTLTGTTLPHRELLTESQRLSLQTPASDERGRVRHYTLSSEDLALINRRRGDPNRLGCFARSYFVLCVSQGGYFNKVSNPLLLYAPSSLSN